MIEVWQLVRPDGTILCEWLVPEHNAYIFQPSHPAIEGDYGWAMKLRREINMSDDDTPDFDDSEFEDMAHSALAEMGKMGLTVFRAVIRDGGSWNEAFSITAAFFTGATKANMEDQGD
jgi:hypothetical protein